jgi:hypothetical protein
MENLSGPASVLQTLKILVIGGRKVEVVAIECYPPGTPLIPAAIRGMVGREAVQLTVKQGNSSSYVWIPVTEETQGLLSAIANAARGELEFTYTSLKPPFPTLTSVRFHQEFYPVYKDKKAALASL